MSIVISDDGLARCSWGSASPEYRDYHDTEWGRELRGDQALFERLSLEAFQAGLSWLLILRRREGFRRAFAGFDPEAVAEFERNDVERLMADPGIVRNRRKVEATIANARAVLALDGSLTDMLWSHQPPPRPRPATMKGVPAVTPESTAMAKTLKANGFRFVGPTTCYALMQATGMVDDHLAGCQVPAKPALRPPAEPRQAG